MIDDLTRAKLMLGGFVPNWSVRSDERGQASWAVPIVLTALEAHQRAAQALRKILGRAQYRVFSDEGRSAQAPGHAHEVPGVWDADNIPELAGKPCEWCSAWSEARAALAELDKVTTR